MLPLVSDLPHRLNVCIADTMSCMRFPPRESGPVVTVHYPFNLLVPH
jgi:hypothetical protein